MSSTEITRWDGSFSTLGLTEDPRDGTILVSGDTLQIEVEAGTAADWWGGSGSYERAPRAYFPITQVQPGTGLLEINARCSELAQTVATGDAGVTIFDSLDNAYVFTYNNSADADARGFTFWKIESDGANTIHTHLTGHPVGAHWYKIFWNNTLEDRRVQNDTYNLPAGNIAFYYSLDDGATYTFLYDYDPAFTPTKIGFFAKKWTTGGSISATWSSVSVVHHELPTGLPAPYHKTICVPSSAPSTVWTASGSITGDVASHNGDTSYIHSHVNGQVQEYDFADIDIDETLYTVMGLRVIAFARNTTGQTGSLRITVRRRAGAQGMPLVPLPVDAPFTVSEDYEPYGITLMNRPDEGLLLRSSAWHQADGSIPLSDYSFGVQAVSPSDEIRVTQFTVEVLYRAKITPDAVFSVARSAHFQALEIEGCRWVPTDYTNIWGPDWSVGSYYYGIDRLPVSGTMKQVTALRSGKIDHAKGLIETPSANFQLIDVDRVVYEAPNGTPSYHLYPQGFYTWLFAYGDRTNINTARLTDTTNVAGDDWNTIKGLNPEDTANSWGQAFIVDAAIASFPSPNTASSYVYLDKEAIWYGTSNTTAKSFGTWGADNLGRGMFGSLNAAHIRNRHTEVYPEVTDHPVIWPGRVVRHWTIPIDPDTGWPFPLSHAVCRSFLWGDHAQTVGPGENTYRVNTAPLEDILKKKVPDFPKMRTAGVDLGGIQSGTPDSDYMDVSSIFSIGVFNATYDQIGEAWTTAQIGPSAAYYDSWKSASEFLANASACMQHTGSNTYVQSSLSGGVVTIVAVPVNQDVYTRLVLRHGVDRFLGFEDKDGVRVDDDKTYVDVGIEPDNQSDRHIASPQVIECEWTGKGPVIAKAVAAPHLSWGFHLNNSDAAEWPSVHAFSVGSKAGKVHIDAKLSLNKASSYFRINDGGIGTTDAIGKYFDTFSNAGEPRTEPSSVYQDGWTGEESPLETTNPFDDIVALPVFCSTDRDPLEAFLLVALSTGFGKNDATYDKLPSGLGAGLNSALFDIRSFEFIGRVLSTWGTRSRSITAPTEIRELLDEELQLPPGAILRQDASGRLALCLQNIPSSTLQGALPSITDDHIIRDSPVEVSHSVARIVNKITLECDYDHVEGKFLTTIEAVEPNSVARFGEKELSISNKGLRTDHAGRGAAAGTSPHTLMGIMGYMLFNRFAWESPEIRMKLTARGFGLKPGDPLLLTANSIQDVHNRTNLGITSRACEMVALDLDEQTGECVATLIYDRLKKETAGWAPSAVLTAWNAGTNTATCSATLFSAADTAALAFDPRLQATDVAYFAAGNKVLISEGNKTAPSNFEATVASVDTANNKLVFSSFAASFTPVAGTWVTFANWGSLVADQLTDSFAVVAYDNGFINSTTTNAFVWSV